VTVEEQSYGSVNVTAWRMQRGKGCVVEEPVLAITEEKNRLLGHRRTGVWQTARWWSNASRAL